MLPYFHEFRSVGYGDLDDGHSFPGLIAGVQGWRTPWSRDVQKGR